MKRILVAGIGNIFCGDDAFGCEVVKQLKQSDLPAETTVTDFGIRSLDLAYALIDGYDAVVLVDAIPNTGQPGTVYLIEPDLNRLDGLDGIGVAAHDMNPMTALKIAQRAGGVKGKLFLIGCEPSVLDDQDGSMELSEPVRTAVPRAMEMIRSLIADLLSEKHPNIGLALA